MLVSWFVSNFTFCALHVVYYLVYLQTCEQIEIANDVHKLFTAYVICQIIGMNEWF